MPIKIIKVPLHKSILNNPWKQWGKIINKIEYDYKGGGDFQL